jgi:hypothetical protein
MSPENGGKNRSKVVGGIIQKLTLQLDAYSESKLVSDETT